MDRNTIKEDVFEILKKYTRKEELLEGATEHSHILDDLKINSARLVDIVLDLEDRFDIEIEDDTVDSIQTVNDVINVVEQATR